MKLAVDAMGSDKGSATIIEACKQFVKDYSDVELYVYGNEEDLKALNGTERLYGVVTTQVMEMTDGALASRRKKDSSMVRAIEDVKSKKVDGMISCGSTGALLSGSTLILGTMDRVERPALLTVLPNATRKGVVFTDIGANATNTPEQIASFAVLGNAYAKGALGFENPKVALLNNGTEAKKGDDLHKTTYQLLSSMSQINFVGNIEGKEMLNGDVDVVVTDGFTGNLVLKSMEGISKFIMSSLKESLMSSLTSKIGALLSKKSLKSLKNGLDPDQFGGAMIVGLKGAVVKGHGSSNSVACYNAIRQLYLVVSSNVLEKVKEEL